MNPVTLSSRWDGRELPHSTGQEKSQQKSLCSSPEVSSNKTPAGISFPSLSVSHLGMRSATSERAIIDIIPQNPTMAGLAPQLQNTWKDSLTELSCSQTPAWIGIWDARWKIKQIKLVSVNNWSQTSGKREDSLGAKRWGLECSESHRTGRRNEGIQPNHSQLTFSPLVSFPFHFSRQGGNSV